MDIIDHIHDMVADYMETFDFIKSEIAIIVPENSKLAACTKLFDVDVIVYKTKRPGFGVIHKSAIPRIDELMGDIYEHFEGVTMTCDHCGHPASTHMITDNGVYQCPWCHMINEAEEMI